MNIPKIVVEFDIQGLRFAVAENISSQLEAYILGLARSFMGMMATSETKKLIEYSISRNLIALVERGQLVKDYNNMWDAKGFLWVDNG